jgi:hypothetical protein
MIASRGKRTSYKSAKEFAEWASLFSGRLFGKAMFQKIDPPNHWNFPMKIWSKSSFSTPCQEQEKSKDKHVHSKNPEPLRCDHFNALKHFVFNSMDPLLATALNDALHSECRPKLGCYKLMFLVRELMIKWQEDAFVLSPFAL